MTSAGGHHVPGTPYNWEHGYVPLNAETAIKNRKGSKVVEALRGKEVGGKSSREMDASIRAAAGRSTVAAHAGPQAPQRVRKTPKTEADVRSMSDDELQTHLIDAMGDHFDEQAFKLVSGELDRREAEQRLREAARAKNTRRRERQDAKRASHLRELLDSGVDEEEAIADAYGISVERQRRQHAIATLRGEGYSGKGLDTLARQSFRDHIYRQWLAAEKATRGTLLTRQGQAAGVDPRSLFSGPESRARKHASEELKAWWDRNGRITFGEWKANLMADSAAGRRLREASGGDFHT